MAKTTIAEKVAALDRKNLEAAMIILQDPNRYAGGLVLWARNTAHRLASTLPALPLDYSPAPEGKPYPD